MRRFFRKAKKSGDHTSVEARAVPGDNQSSRDELVDVGAVPAKDTRVLLESQGPVASIPINDTPATELPITDTVKSDISSFPSSLVERLWLEAYDALKSENTSLVDSFEKILSRKLDTEVDESGKGCDNRTLRQAQLSQLIQDGLKKTEREAQVKQGIGDVVGIIRKAKGAVDFAIQAVPHAAVVWSGACFALEILVHPATASEENRDGIVYVASRMDWYLKLAGLLLKENSLDEADGLRHELERRLVDLYKLILGYQLTSVCSYYRHRGLEFLRDIILLDNWNENLAKIRAAEALFGQDSSQFTVHQMLSALNRIADNTDAKKIGIEQHRLGADGPGKPPFVVPLGRNEDFVGRDSLLAQLMENIPPSAHKDNCQRTAIEGLGGIGKTQIALEAAYRVRDKYDCGIFWVPAVDVTTFENAFHEIGRQLGIKEIDDDKADVKSLVKNTLSRSDYDWLLIIDNADDIELLCGVTGLASYLPFTVRGSILFTTRNSGVVSKLGILPKSVVAVPEMSEPEAVQLLTESLREDQIDDQESTKELLQLLAYLPLAIKQAAAYMAETRLPATKYLKHCRSSDSNFIKLLSQDFTDLGRYSSIKNPIATTWLISFDHISRHNELAARSLKHLCFFAEKDIPIALLPPADELDADEAIGTLRAYAFITVRADQTSFDIHRLVRLAMQAWLAEEGELESCFTGVIQRLGEVFPYPKYNNRVIWEAYMPHGVQALHFQDHCEDEETYSWLMFLVARSFSRTVQYEKAEIYYKRALELNEQLYGVEHQRTLDCIPGLAATLQFRGKYDEAEVKYREHLELTTKMYGPEHPLTLKSTDGFARALLGHNKFDEAKQLLQQGIMLKTKVLGAEHSSTLLTMHNLAYTFFMLREYDEAETMIRETLRFKTKVLGPENLETILSMSVLAEILWRQKKYGQAETACREALRLMAKFLEVEHPRVSASLSTLGLILWSQRRYDEVEPILQQAAELKTKVFGAEHPLACHAVLELERCRSLKEHIEKQSTTKGGDIAELHK